MKWYSKLSIAIAMITFLGSMIYYAIFGGNELLGTIACIGQLGWLVPLYEVTFEDDDNR